MSVLLLLLFLSAVTTGTVAEVDNEENDVNAVAEIDNDETDVDARMLRPSTRRRRRRTGPGMVMGDWDGDGLLDLIQGTLSSGHLGYYQGASSNGAQQQPCFQEGSDDKPTCPSPTLLRRYGQSNPVDSSAFFVRGYVSPEIVDWDGDGDMDLIVGDGSYGRLHYFERLGNTPATSGRLCFTDDTKFVGTTLVAETTVSNVNVCQQRCKDTEGCEAFTYMYNDPEFCVFYCNDGACNLYGADAVATSDDADGRISGPATCATGSLVERMGSDNPFDGIDVMAGTKSQANPDAVDWDGDGDLDLLIGDRLGNVYFYERKSDGSFDISGRTKVVDTVVGPTSPHAVDWDGDGDLDLVVGNNYGQIEYFERQQDGSLKELFGEENPFKWIDVGIVASPALGDYDGDGDIDLVIADRYGRIDFFQHYGLNITNTSSVFVLNAASDRSVLLNFALVGVFSMFFGLL